MKNIFHNISSRTIVEFKEPLKFLMCRPSVRSWTLFDRNRFFLFCAVVLSIDSLDSSARPGTPIPEAGLRKWRRTDARPPSLTRLKMCPVVVAMLDPMFP